MGLYDELDAEVLGTSNNIVKIKKNELFSDIDSEIEAEPVKEAKSFAGSHPFISSLPEAGKQFGLRAVKSYPEFAKGANDLIALTGDKTGLKGLADYGKQGVEFWENTSQKIPIDPKYQGMQGLSSKETFLPTVFGSIGDQTTNILTALAGGAGGAKAAAQLGAKGLAKAGLITTGASLPNLAQEGQYLDKIEQFKQINGRIPTQEELAQIQNVALGEKAINTALETVADKMLFGKLLPEGTVTKSVKGILKSAGQQALTEAATEGMQESVSIGAEKLLGINQGDNLARLADSMAIGGITGGVIGGGSTAISQPYSSNFTKQEIPQFVKDVSATIIDPAKAVADEIVNRLNPNNYVDTIEFVPQETGVGLSQRTEYVPKVKKVYKKPNVELDVSEALIPFPTQNATQQTANTVTEQGNTNDSILANDGTGQPLLTANNPRLLTDNGTGFVLGESGNLIQNIAPNTYRKQKNNVPLLTGTDHIAQVSKMLEDNNEKNFNSQKWFEEKLKNKNSSEINYVSDSEMKELKNYINNTKKTILDLKVSDSNLAVVKGRYKNKFFTKVSDQLNYDLTTADRNFNKIIQDIKNHAVSTKNKLSEQEYSDLEERMEKAYVNIDGNEKDIENKYDNFYKAIKILDNYFDYNKIIKNTKVKKGIQSGRIEKTDRKNIQGRAGNIPVHDINSKQTNTIIDNKGNDEKSPSNIARSPFKNKTMGRGNIEQIAPNIARKQGIVSENVDNTLENGNNIINKEELENARERQTTTRSKLGDNIGNDERRERRERKSNEGMDREKSRNGSSNVGIRPENNSVTLEHKATIEKQYNNQHELNQSIENFVKNKEYDKYVELPNDIKNWLKSYTGAGGLEKQGAKGKGLLSEYYTPKNIVKKMWDLTAQYINTDGAKVLEPSVGIGRFLESAPDNTTFDVVEMNPISAKITELLYPNANVEIGEFQKRFIKNNAPVKNVTPEYDIVIGNPPYGPYNGIFKGMGEGKGIDRFETYFINRGLDSLKENGIMTFIIPSSFLDGAITPTKLQIGQKAELLDAYRLPENTFDTTSQGTDIIVLRKTEAHKADRNLSLGKWFKEHPEKILGETLERKGRYGKQEKYVKGDKNSIEKIDTSKKNIKETVIAKSLTTEKESDHIAKNSKKVKKSDETIKGNVEYNEYKPLLTVPYEEMKYFTDTRVDGTLPKEKYSPDEHVNQYNGGLYNDFNYLQGDIYEKLDALEKENISDEQKNIQKKKLESVLPKPKTIKEISFNPTADFVKDFVVGERSEWNPYERRDENVTVNIVKDFKDYLYKIGKEERENVEYRSLIKYIDGEKVTFTYDYPANMISKKEREIYQKQQRPKKFAKLKKVAEKLFNNYIEENLSADKQKELASKWNRNFNNLYNPDYSKMPMIVKGLSDTFNGEKLKLNKLQEKGVNFLTNKGIGLLGFEVGTGKTLAGTIATVQNMQMGRSKKPLILVPKQVKDNWIKEIHQAFPNIKVNDIGNLSKFNGEIEDGSVSVGTYEALSNIWYEPEIVEKMKNDLFDISGRIVKEGEKRTERKTEADKQKAEEIIGKALKNNKELFKLSELGFDHITVDEAHNFKNLFNKAETESKQVGENKGNSYGGIQVQGGDSQRAARLFLLTQQILNNNNNRNVFMLTATPFSNNPLEVFNMLSYLSKDGLEKAGLYNAYQFMETYADTDADWAVNTSNNVVMKEMVKGFKNANSLKEIIKNVMLMGNADEVGIKRPEKYTNTIKLEPSKKQLEIIREAEEYLIEHKSENGAIFKALHQSRMATLSPDIAKGNISVTPKEFIENSPKLHYIMNAIEKMQKKDPSTSQLIYMPMGINYLPKIKQYLVDKGVFKPDEIEVITSEVKDDKVVDITESFNDRNGKVKLIIGTEKIKEGMNLNKNSSVLYIPQLDWNPTDFVQVVGRIWRQGNRYNKIRVVVPLLKNSSDPFMFQKLSEKTSRLNDLMSDDAGDYIDSGELNTEEERLNMITLPDKKASMFVMVENEKINSQINELNGKLDTVERLQNDLLDAQANFERFKRYLNDSENSIKNIDENVAEYTYNRIKSNIAEYKKQVTKYKNQVERLKNTIKNREFDFKGKDSIENIKNEISKLEEQKENLKELELKKLKEYTKEYEKNQEKAKTIDEHINDFEKQTDELYNEDFLTARNDKETANKYTLEKFIQFEKPLHNRNKVITKLGDIVNWSSELNKLSDLVQGVENVDVCLFSLEEIKLYGDYSFASYSPIDNIIKVMPKATFAELAHEIQHAKDMKTANRSLRGKLAISNAYIGNIVKKLTVKSKSNIMKKIGDFAYRNTLLEKRAYNTQKEFERLYNERKRNSFENQQQNNENNSIFNRQRRTNSKESRGIEFHSYARSEQVSEKSKRKDTSSSMGTEQNSINNKVKDDIRTWYADIEKGRYDVNKSLNSFINVTKGIAKEYSNKFGIKINDKQIREIMPFLRERTDLPEKLDRPDLKKIFDKLTGQDKQRLTKLADDVSAKFDKYYTEYQQAKGVEDINSIENHISHIWDLDKKQKSLLTNYFTTSSKYAKNRTIDTLVKGIDGFEVNGELIQFKPKTLDYAEILKTSSDNFIKATADMKLADKVKNLETKEGEKLVLPTRKAPSDWVEFNHPALNKSVYMGSNGDITILGKSPVKVHPAIAKSLNTVFQTPYLENAFMNAYDKTGAVLKQSQLGFSGFHVVALSESALGNIGVKGTLKLLNPKRIYDEVAKGNWGIYKDDTIAKQAIDDGLQFGSTLDLDRGTIERIADDVTNFVEKNIPVIGKYLKILPKTLGELQRINNKILWDYLHNNYKLECYKLFTTQEAERLKRPLKKSERQEIAQWVNDSFGGQIWENLGISLLRRKNEQRILLSPDWLRSTTRQFLGFVSNEKLENLVDSKAKQNKFWEDLKDITEEWGINSNTGESALRGRLARSFWIRALIYSAILYNMMNAFFRYRDKEEYPQYYPKQMTAKDYSLLANSKGSKTFVFIGRDSEGKERYLRLGKQFREMPEMVEKPLEKLGGKLSPLIQIASQVTTGHSPGGFKNYDMYQDGWNAPQKQGWDRVIGASKVISKSFLPYSLNDVFNPDKDFTAWSFFAPVGKGMTKYKAQKGFEEIYKKGNKKELKEIKQALTRNGFSKKDIDKLQKTSLSDFGKHYKDRYIKALEENNKKEILKIKNDLNKTSLTPHEKQKIYKLAIDKYMKNK